MTSYAYYLCALCTVKTNIFIVYVVTYTYICVKFMDIDQHPSIVFLCICIDRYGVPNLFGPPLIDVKTNLLLYCLRAMKFSGYISFNMQNVLRFPFGTTIKTTRCGHALLLSIQYLLFIGLLCRIKAKVYLLLELMLWVR